RAVRSSRGRRNRHGRSGNGPANPGYTSVRMMRGFFAAVFLVGLATAGLGPAAAATPKLLPARVHVAGVKVGGLRAATATRAVEQAFASPLTVRVDKRTF